MHTVDVVVVCVAIVAVVLCALVLARQRYMLHVVGAIPLAISTGRDRWVYGIARYAGGQLRWYRSLGLGTRPSRQFDRADLRIVGHRVPRPDEMGSLRTGAVIVECRTGGSSVLLAIGENAFTGFISWIEASSPTG